MTSSVELARRERAHLRADMAWSRAGRRSRTNGLAEMVRGIDDGPSTTPPEVRAHRQHVHKQRLRDATARAQKNARVGFRKPLDRSRYFPHQSERERTRGERQAARRAG